VSFTFANCQRYCKGLIEYSAQAKATYGAEYPDGSVFDVVVEHDTPADDHVQNSLKWMATLIVYTEPRSNKKHKPITGNPVSCYNAEDAMSALLFDLSELFPSR
jgi:hypothetical protein